MRKILKRVATVAVAGAMLAQTVAPAYARISTVISGNGNDSINRARLRIRKSLVVRQSNRAWINNLAVAVVNTGGINVSDNTDESISITTGDASASATIVNTGNVNIANVDCCCVGGGDPCDHPCDLPKDGCEE
jgi:hypothetical protein